MHHVKISSHWLMVIYFYQSRIFDKVKHMFKCQGHYFTTIKRDSYNKIWWKQIMLYKSYTFAVKTLSDWTCLPTDNGLQIEFSNTDIYSNKLVRIWPERNMYPLPVYFSLKLIIAVKVTCATMFDTSQTPRNSNKIIHTQTQQTQKSQSTVYFIPYRKVFYPNHIL